MSRIEKDKVAEIEYTLKLSDGETIDATDGRPLPYLHGAGNLIPGLESALEGREVGDSFSVTVEPADGYGSFDDDLVEEVPRSEFPDDVELSEGDEVGIETDDGAEITAYVSEIDGDTIHLDLNHPLAGETLYFDVQVVSVRDATAEELETKSVDDPYADDDHDGPGHHHCNHGDCNGHH